MASGDDLQPLFGSELRSGVFVECRHAAEGKQAVQAGNGACRAEEIRRAQSQLGANLFVDPQFHFVNLRLSVQHQRFIFFEFRRDKALVVDQGLLADVVIGCLVCHATRDFDVVAKHLVEADFEGFDSCPLAFSAFEPGNPLSGVS